MAKKNDDSITQVADILLLIGGLHLGLGVVNYPILGLLGADIGQILAGLIGLSALYLIYGKYLAK